MSDLALVSTGGARRRGRGRKRLHTTGQVIIGIIVLIWTVLPLYNMVEVALRPKGAVFSGNLFPSHPTLAGFWTVLTQNYWYLKHFWHEMGNSLYIGIATAVLTLLIGSMTSFVIGRLRIKGARFVSTAALLTYVIPMSFLAIPFYRVMQNYGLGDNLWAVIIVEVTFATPYAIFIFTEYAGSIPLTLDEAARVDGAGPFGIYWRIYVPLMAPAMVAVGTYALLLAWNEYLYLYLLLSSPGNMTVPVALGQFLNSDEAPWNLMMATAVIYALPPVFIYYIFRRHMTTGLTMGGVKG
ncbi:MAG: carbohydrate ABC transporter permease [Acetobacteraceae bacterium]